MDPKTLHELLEHVAAGRVAPAEAASRLADEPLARLAHGVTLDLERTRRLGMGEAVFGQGKSTQQLAVAVAGLHNAGQPALATRVSAEQAALLLERFPEGEYSELARLFCLGKKAGLAEPWSETGDVMVVCAGASDLPVALEAYGAAQFFGLKTGLASDAGVAGLHRMLPALPALRKAKVCIVAAGMEGALPSVIAGLCPAPIIAVPTSVGYGAAFGGVAALLGMLTSCAPGIAVVNIDNGFGAAAMAARILQQQ